VKSTEITVASILKARMARLRSPGTKTPPVPFLGFDGAAPTLARRTQTTNAQLDNFFLEAKKHRWEKITDCPVLGGLSKTKAESFCESFTALCPISLSVHLIEWFGSLSVLD
jgi:hypothetical protein